MISLLRFRLLALVAVQAGVTSVLAQPVEAPNPAVLLRAGGELVQVAELSAVPKSSHDAGGGAVLFTAGNPAPVTAASAPPALDALSTSGEKQPAQVSDAPGSVAAKRGPEIDRLTANSPGVSLVIRGIGGNRVRVEIDRQAMPGAEGEPWPARRLSASIPKP